MSVLPTSRPLVFAPFYFLLSLLFLILWIWKRWWPLPTPPSSLHRQWGLVSVLLSFGLRLLREGWRLLPLWGGWWWGCLLWRGSWGCQRSERGGPERSEPRLERGGGEEARVGVGDNLLRDRGKRAWLTRRPVTDLKKKHTHTKQTYTYTHTLHFSLLSGITYY